MKLEDLPAIPSTEPGAVSSHTYPSKAGSQSRDSLCPLPNAPPIDEHVEAVSPKLESSPALLLLLLLFKLVLMLPLVFLFLLLLLK